MSDIDFVDSYKYLKNFVSILESEEPNYQLCYIKEGVFHTYPAKFQKTYSGDFELSFESKEFYHPDLFYCISTTISSEWYNIPFSNLDIPSSNFTLSNNSSEPFKYRVLTKSFSSGIDDNWKNAIFCAYCTYNHNDFNPDNCGIIPSGRKDLIRYYKIHLSGTDFTVFFGLKDDDNHKELEDKRFISFITFQPITEFSSFRRIVAQLQ